MYMFIMFSRYVSHGLYHAEFSEWRLNVKYSVSTLYLLPHRLSLTYLSWLRSLYNYSVLLLASKGVRAAALPRLYNSQEFNITGLHNFYNDLLATLLAIFSWIRCAKGMRSQILSLKERGFIRLARISDESYLEIIFKEILPNVSYVGVMFGVFMCGAMMAEVGLKLRGGVMPQLKYITVKYVGEAEKIVMAIEKNEIDVASMDYIEFSLNHQKETQSFDFVINQVFI